MKKIFIMILSISLLSIISCSRDTNITEENLTPLNETLYQRAAGGIKFAWGTEDPGDPETRPCQGRRTSRNCGKCPGVCIRFVFGIATEPLTEEEFINGTSISILRIEDEKLSFSPQDDFIDSGDGVVRISDHFFIGNEASEMLGYENITILRGEYEIDYTNNEYGEVLFNIEAR